MSAFKNPLRYNMVPLNDGDVELEGPPKWCWERNMKKQGQLVVSVFVALSLIVALGGAAFAGPDRTGQAIAFARIDSTGAVLSSGGKGVTSASATRVATGDYVVTFNGHFPRTIASNQLIAVATAESNIFAVSNAIAPPFSGPAPTRTQIQVQVFTFDPASKSNEDNNCYVAVFLGR